MFPRLPTRATFVADTNFVSGTKNVSDFVQKHFVSATSVSQFAQHGNTTFFLCPARLRNQETSWVAMCPQQCVFVCQGLYTDTISNWWVAAGVAQIYDWTTEPGWRVKVKVPPALLFQVRNANKLDSSGNKLFLCPKLEGVKLCFASYFLVTVLGRRVNKCTWLS